MSLFGRPTYGYGNRGGAMKWIIAIIIAAIGIITYLKSGQVNPVTGEKQYVAMTTDQEKALGLQAAPQMAAEMGGAADPRAIRMPASSTRSARTCQSYRSLQKPYSDNFHYHLLNDPKPSTPSRFPAGKSSSPALFTTAWKMKPARRRSRPRDRPRHRPPLRPADAKGKLARCSPAPPASPLATAARAAPWPPRWSSDDAVEVQPPPMSFRPTTSAALHDRRRYDRARCCES